MHDQMPCAATLSDESTIYHNYGVGVLPLFSFGALTLTEGELSFAPQAFPWTPSWGRVGLECIAKAEAKPRRNIVRRRLVYLLGVLLFPIPGLLGLFWLPRFWHRAGGPTLEVQIRRGRLARNRVYIVANAVQWAERINREVEKGNPTQR